MSTESEIDTITDVGHLQSLLKDKLKQIQSLQTYYEDRLRDKSRRIEESLRELGLIGGGGGTAVQAAAEVSSPVAPEIVAFSPVRVVPIPQNTSFTEPPPPVSPPQLPATPPQTTTIQPLPPQFRFVSPKIFAKEATQNPTPTTAPVPDEKKIQRTPSRGSPGSGPVLTTAHRATPIIRPPSPHVVGPKRSPRKSGAFSPFRGNGTPRNDTRTSLTTSHITVTAISSGSITSSGTRRVRPTSPMLRKVVRKE